MSKYFIFIPNLLSIIRIALVYPILNNIFIGNFIYSLGFFIVASLTDALDGFLARKMNWPIFELHAGHDAMFTNAKETLNLLIKICN